MESEALLSRFVTRLLDEDQQMGIKRWFDHDVDNDVFTIRTEQETGIIQQFNRYEHNEYDERTGFTGDIHRVARVPIVILEQLKATGEHPTQDQKAFAKWLDKPENKIWRTRPGRMSK